MSEASNGGEPTMHRTLFPFFLSFMFLTSVFSFWTRMHRALLGLDDEGVKTLVTLLLPRTQQYLLCPGFLFLKTLIIC